MDGCLRCGPERLRTTGSRSAERPAMDGRAGHIAPWTAACAAAPSACEPLVRARPNARPRMAGPGIPPKDGCLRQRPKRLRIGRQVRFRHSPPVGAPHGRDRGIARWPRMAVNPLRRGRGRGPLLQQSSHPRRARLGRAEGRHVNHRRRNRARFGGHAEAPWPRDGASKTRPTGYMRVRLNVCPAPEPAPPLRTADPLLLRLRHLHIDFQRLHRAALAQAADRRGVAGVAATGNAHVGIGRADPVGRVEAHPAQRA